MPAILLFFSGAVALVYQTLWVKQLGLVVGVDVYAVTTGVSAFFAGLAVGGAVVGRWADRTTRPFALYAILEVGIAALGVGGTLVLARGERLFVALETSVGPLAWTLPFVAIGLPAFLMGGTLPALVRALRPDDTSIGRASGLLYAANTAGAIAGTLATPFLLVPVLGIQGTGLAAGGSNLLLAAVALLVSRARAPRPGVVDESTREPYRRGSRLALLLYALAGGVALGYEVVWTQTIVPFLSTRAHAFAIVLAVYLAGLVLGSFLYARFADRVRRPWATFGLLVTGAGATAVAVFAVLGQWLPEAQTAVGRAVFDITGSQTLRMTARFAVPAVAIVLVPTTLLGAAFPAAMRLTGQADRIGHDVGAVVALNTAGGIAGTCLTGFVLVPRLGLVRSLGVLAVAGALIGAVAIVRGSTARTERRIPSALSSAVAAVLVLAVGFTVVMTPRDQLARLLADRHGGSLVFYEESPAGTVAVLEQEASAGKFRRLYIQGVSNSGDAMPSRRYMRLQALLPVLIHKGQPRSVLVIGLGTGITTGALLADASLERRVCAELVPAVVRAVEHFDGNLDVRNDPRIDLRVADGRHELLRSEERYDVITLEPPPPSAAGVVNLYSRDFYELCRDRLASDGLLAQWWPLATQNDEDSQSLVRSLLDVFPHVTLWTTELHEMLVIGSASLFELDHSRIAGRLSQQSLAAALEEVGVNSPTSLLATYVTDRGGLERYAGDAPPVTDDRPRIEYAPWLRNGEFSRVLERVAGLRSPIPLKADAATRKAVEEERQRLWAFYKAGQYAYTGQGDRWEALMRRLLPFVRSNRYYQWFASST